MKMYRNSKKMVEEVSDIIASLPISGFDWILEIRIVIDIADSHERNAFCMFSIPLRIDYIKEKCGKN